MKNIDKNWVLDFLALADDENFLGFTLYKGVLRISLKDSVVPFNLDFMIFMEREHGIQNATVEFDLPLPECITPDGHADYESLVKTFEGPDEIVAWRERIEVQDSQYLAEMHHRNLSCGGDL